MGKSTTCKIVTPENFILKLCTRDYVGEMTSTQILVSIGAVGASPQIGTALPLCDLFRLSCPVLVVLSLPFYSVSYTHLTLPTIYSV